MFEMLYIRIIEWTVTGKPIEASLAEATSISRKTWDAGGPKRASAKARVAKEMREFGIQQLLDNGMSKEEIDAWLSKFPETTDKEPFSLSTLVQMFSIGQEPPPETLALATRMDKLAHVLGKASLNNDFSGYKHALLGSPLLERSYFTDIECEMGIDGEPSALRKAQMAAGWDELNTSIKLVYANLLFSLLACWDLEFCQTYFPEMQPFPLFELIMLRAAHNFQENPKPGRDPFRLPVRNLLDLIAMLGGWIRNSGTKPLQEVRVKEMATWLELGNPQIPAQKLWNWRSGRDAFVLKDLELVWRRFSGVYDEKKATIPPRPLLVAAGIWQHLQVQIDRTRKQTKYIFFNPPYLWWWNYHRTSLAAKGITWGDAPWPACISDQSSRSGVKSPDSSLSSQSSGRPSKSRDSQ